RLVITAGLAFGAVEVVLGLMPTYLTFAALTPLLGFSLLTMLNAANTTVQLSTAPEMRGRVMALYMTVIMGGTPIGSPVVGRGGEPPRWRRVELRYVDLKAGRRLQVTGYDDTQAYTSNHDDGAVVVDELLSMPFANWHVDTTTTTHQLRVTKKGRPLLHSSAR